MRLWNEIIAFGVGDWWCRTMSSGQHPWMRNWKSLKANHRSVRERTGRARIVLYKSRSGDERRGKKTMPLSAENMYRQNKKAKKNKETQRLIRYQWHEQAYPRVGTEVEQMLPFFVSVQLSSQNNRALLQHETRKLHWSALTVFIFRDT